MKLSPGPESPSIIAAGATMPRIVRCPDAPYFMTEAGKPWTPIGQNDAINWPELAGLFRRRDLAGVERHLRHLKDHGVTCLRLMLEYCQGQHRYLEKPARRFVPNMVQLWDDLFLLLEKVGLRVLLTPYDTFFMWVRWRDHPYNRRNGGPCAGRGQLLTCPGTRDLIKQRLAFASDRWGGSPALFAWDLWNEIHPAHGGDDPAAVGPFIDDIGPWLRAREQERFGRANLQTVSIFGPELLKHPELAEPIFRHPALDFANTHLYETRTIDDPRDTVAPARAVGRLTRAAVQDAGDLRPVFDSEHGPIHRFKDKKRSLPEAFDDEYFRLIQWAHLASGGAGGGMRWPNRHPHCLTHGMRSAQRALAAFLPLIDWTRFRRGNLNEEIALSNAKLTAFGCGDRRQAIVWLLRTDTRSVLGTVRQDAAPLDVRVEVPGLEPGSYDVALFDTVAGRVVGERSDLPSKGVLAIPAGAVATDLALAIRPARGGR